MSFFEFIQTYGPRFLAGTQMTLILVVCSAALIMLVALPLALLRLSGQWWLNGPAVMYIEFFRGTSLLVQVYWLFFVLPLFGLTLEPFSAGVMAIGLNGGAYGAELIRGAVLAVPRGQWEAARALNMSLIHRMRRIILPQAFALVLPAWGNVMIDVVKASALVSLISMVDLMFIARQVNAQTFLSVQAFGTALIVYYILARFMMTPMMRALERVAARRLGKA